MLEDARNVAHSKCAEDQDLRAHSRLPQDDALFDIGDGQNRRAGLLEGHGNRSRSVPVRVGLDDGNDSGNPGPFGSTRAGGEKRRNRAEIRLKRVEIDVGERAACSHRPLRTDDGSRDSRSA
jgi:hypothetical protein